MSHEDLDNLTWTKLKVSELSAYYGQELKDEVVAMYAEDLMDLPREKLLEAFHAIRRDPVVSKFPLPAKIRAMVMPPETPKDQARDVALRLLSAVDKFDYNWDHGWVSSSVKYYSGGQRTHHSWEDAARAEVGSLGLEIIRRFHGWTRFFNHVTEMDRGQAMAQIRDYAEALQNRVKAGKGNEPPALPVSPSVSGVIAAVGQAKRIPAPKDDE